MQRRRLAHRGGDANDEPVQMAAKCIGPSLRSVCKISLQEAG
jgi:hypothetical protein